MGIKHGAVGPGHVAGATTGGSDNGTLETPGGPIAWTRGADGTLNAEGSGQKLTVAGTDESDGSWQKSVAFSLAGASPYLTMRAWVQNADRSAGTTLEAGQSQLTLTVTGIDWHVTSGTATVSGTLNGSVVNWTGPVDLTSNPFTGNAVPGWPQGSFAAELQKAAFFGPLARGLVPQTTVAPLPGQATTGTGHGHVIASAGGVLGRAGAWCMGGAIAGSAAGPATLGTSMLVGCAGGAVGSLGNDLITWLDEPNVTGEPPPLPDFPVSEPIDSGPDTQTQHDDPPPPPSDGPDPGSGGQGPIGSGDGGGGGGGGGDTLDDDHPGHEES